MQTCHYRDAWARVPPAPSTAAACDGNLCAQERLVLGLQGWAFHQKAGAKMTLVI